MECSVPSVPKATTPASHLAFSPCGGMDGSKGVEIDQSVQSVGIHASSAPGKSG